MADSKGRNPLDAKTLIEAKAHDFACQNTNPNSNELNGRFDGLEFGYRAGAEEAFKLCAEREARLEAALTEARFAIGRFRHGVKWNDNSEYFEEVYLNLKKLEEERRAAKGEG